MEAVKQGSVSIGLRSNKNAVLLGLKRSPHAMASFQEKIYKIDDHLAICMSGFTADGRYLTKYLRGECSTYKYLHGIYHPINRLVEKVSESIFLNRISS